MKWKNKVRLKRGVLITQERYSTEESEKLTNFALFGLSEILRIVGGSFLGVWFVIGNDTEAYVKDNLG